MKYLVSVLLALGLFVAFRPNHPFTYKTWLYLLVVHAPIPLLLFALERAKKIQVHPIVCFFCVWLGGLLLGSLVGSYLLSPIGSSR